MRTLFLILIALTAAAHDVTLAWDASPGAQGYRVSYGTTAGQHPTTQDVGPATTAIVALADGQWFFVVTAYNSGGESAPSNEVAYLVRNILPATVSADGAGHVVVSPTIGNVPCPNGLILQRSDDLKTWTDMSSFPVPSSPIIFTDAVVPRCFYRLTIP